MHRLLLHILFAFPLLVASCGQQREHMLSILDFGQIVSRFTWEYSQNIFGYELSQLRLVTEDIDHVEYFDGATYVVNDNSHSNKGITLGSFININDMDEMPVDENEDFAPRFISAER